MWSSPRWSRFCWVSELPKAGKAAEEKGRPGSSSGLCCCCSGMSRVIGSSSFINVGWFMHSSSRPNLETGRLNVELMRHCWLSPCVYILFTLLKNEELNPCFNWPNFFTFGSCSSCSLCFSSSINVGDYCTHIWYVHVEGNGVLMLAEFCRLMPTKLRRLLFHPTLHFPPSIFRPLVKPGTVFEQKSVWGNSATGDFPNLMPNCWGQEKQCGTVHCPARIHFATATVRSSTTAHERW